MGVTPIRDHGEDSRCGALQPILSLLAGAERGSEQQVSGLHSQDHALSVCCARVKLSLAWSAALCLVRCLSLLPGPPDGLLSLPVRRSRALEARLPILIVALQLWRCLVLLCAPEQHQ